MTEEKTDRYKLLAKFSGMPIATEQACALAQFVSSNGTREGYDYAVAYTQEREHHFITFIGEPGRGKTHLALGIGWRWLELEAGVVRYWPVSELLDTIRREYDHKVQDDYGNPRPGAFDHAKACDLLILDDLGVEKPTEWAIDRLDTLVNHRWLENKATVFTTNLAPSQIQPRIRSRIKEGVTITLEGVDYREHKAKMRKRRTNA